MRVCMYVCISMLASVSWDRPHSHRKCLCSPLARPRTSRILLPRTKCFSFQIAALAVLTEVRVLNAVDKVTLEKEVVPRVCREACKNSDTGVKVSL